LEKLGKRIRALRISKGYTSYDYFAYDYNFNRTQWGRFENGKDLRFTSSLKIAAAFEMTLEEFFSEGF